MELTTQSSALDLMDFITRMDDFVMDDNLQILDIHPIVSNCEDRSYSENGTIFIQRQYVSTRPIKNYEELYVRITITNSGAKLDNATYFSRQKAVLRQDQAQYSDAFREMVAKHFQFD